MKKMKVKSHKTKDAMLPERRSSRSRGRLTGRLVPVLMALFVLASCEATLPSQRLPELTYNHLQPLTFTVGAVDIAMDYKPPLAAPNVDHLFPVPPATALRRWGAGRLKTSGRDGVVRLIITDASVVETTLVLKKGLTGVFTKEPSERYEAKLEATLEIRDGSGTRVGFAQANVNRTVTVREDANINERDLARFRLTEQLVKDFDAEMEKNVRLHLRKWLVL